ncbi:helix-turn-helix domain-containing protein [Variovorax terrae]|uniref:XRE family transcriptional regulator n=1 Tax=Variovorax terrae TaxID=2923278 RepID=A0A9X1VW27_9BURK|nr:XRE family transcriptional regulator [Variovorax terrae]MCJ0764025.1 XRE family transcriptional regulator [Variovorax terrae]
MLTTDPTASLPDEEAASSATLNQLGSRLRELRAEKGMTLAELSLRSQVSVGMLSHIERGQTSPSLKTLERLRLALEVPLARFFEVESARPKDDGIVMRAAHRRSLPFPKLGLTKELLSPSGHAGLELLMLVIEPGGGSGSEPWSRIGEKGGLVLQGSFELHVGDQIHMLNEGDSFQFDSSQPHFFRNIGKGQAQVLWVIKSDEAG